MDFAKNDIFDANTCEFSDISIRNTTLCSDMAGNILTLNYNGSEDAVFQNNVVQNVNIDNCTLFFVDIFVLNLLQSEMKECFFNNF